MNASAVKDRFYMQMALDLALRRSGEGRGSVRVEVTDVRWGEPERTPWLALERLLLEG